MRVAGRSSRSPPGGPVPLGRSGERRLFSVVHAEPAARGIISTVLRDVYLADTVDEAVERNTSRPTRRSSRQTGC